MNEWQFWVYDDAVTQEEYEKMTGRPFEGHEEVISKNGQVLRASRNWAELYPPGFVRTLLAISRVLKEALDYYAACAEEGEIARAALKLSEEKYIEWGKGLGDEGK